MFSTFFCIDDLYIHVLNIRASTLYCMLSVCITECALKNACAHYAIFAAFDVWAVSLKQATQTN